ncbi:hypothetical protein YC2023_107918 [Brassica napus]
MKATSSRKDIQEGPLEGPHNHRVPGRKSIEPPGSRTKVHPASEFQDESPSSLRVPGRKSIQPQASGFLDESPSSLRVPGRKSIQPPVYEESHPRALSFRRMYL